MKKTHPPAFMQYPPQTKKQSSDLSAGMQALPVGKIIGAKVLRQCAPFWRERAAFQR